MVLGAALSKKVISVPFGYVTDTNAGYDGVITPKVFQASSGVAPDLSSALLSGYKLNYITDPRLLIANDPSNEVISITLLQFSSSDAATSYLNKTRYETLSYAAPNYSAFPDIPGSIRADGTKPYEGGYLHAVAMVRGSIYALVAYGNAVASPAPLEFREWVLKQYSML